MPTTNNTDLMINMIRFLASNRHSWQDIIEYYNKRDIPSISFLDQLITDEKITFEDWKQIVERVYEMNEEASTFDGFTGSVITDGSSDEHYQLFSAKGSSWQVYKRLLRDKEYEEKSITNIEKTSFRILKRLKLKTPDQSPILGLVIGNVQSGKTANMAALMTMAADNGFNLFVILSGTIENLRKQTEDRLCKDLIIDVDGQTAARWTAISSEIHAIKSTLNFHLENDKYFTVCLKNKSRLDALTRLLWSDENKKRQMKILVIDDEADQAGINTADLDSDKKTQINRKIVSLVYNKKNGVKPVKSSYGSMNYIGYTATPYANVLNESPDREDSLYPRNFVAVLDQSTEYFGPQQIFGFESTPQMPIIHEIPESEIKQINDISAGSIGEFPNSLENAIIWFFCCVACFRFWGFVQPISMLIHTSQLTDSHDLLAKRIAFFIKSIGIDALLTCASSLYKKERSSFSSNDLFLHYPSYSGKSINNYPDFREIEPFVRQLYEAGLQRIMMDEEGDFQFTNGIHLCIDNCKNNPKSGDSDYVRLTYPNKKTQEILGFSTAFIVVGGSTLSRGLTIEGLVSTYFLRTAIQADSLMQMGRWFGYRRGYELLPRIWLSPKALRQFKFLSFLDQSLRREMKQLDDSHVRPDRCGIKVINSPNYQMLTISAKKKMQDATIVDTDYSGLITQTTLFFSDEASIHSNLQALDNLVLELKKGVTYKKKDATYVWYDVIGSVVFKMLSQLKIPNVDTELADIELLEEWYNKQRDKKELYNWNVVISGTHNSSKRVIHDVPISLVNRSKKKFHINDGIYRIGVLRSVNDLYIDCDMENAKDDLKEKLKNPTMSDIFQIRNQANCGKTPSLIIYLINKNSIPIIKDSTSREPLNSIDDLVGITVVIPLGDPSKQHNESLRIRIANQTLNLEDNDEVSN